MKAYVRLVDGWLAEVQDIGGDGQPAAVRLLVEGGKVDPRGFCFLLPTYVARGLADALVQSADRAEDGTVAWVDDRDTP